MKVRKVRKVRMVVVGYAVVGHVVEVETWHGGSGSVVYGSV